MSLGRRRLKVTERIYTGRKEEEEEEAGWVGSGGDLSIFLEKKGERAAVSRKE